MTLNHVAKAAAAAILTLAAGFAAADTQSLAVSASVKAVCKFNSGQTPALAFGEIDPSLSGDKTATANVLYRCTNGTSASVTDVTGPRNMSGSGTAAGEMMAYTLAFDSGASGTGSGFGSGKDITLAVSGKITATQYENAMVGSYADTVTLTVTP